IEPVTRSLKSKLSLKEELSVVTHMIILMNISGTSIMPPIFSVEKKFPPMIHQTHSHLHRKPFKLYNTHHRLVANQLVDNCVNVCLLNKNSKLIKPQNVQLLGSLLKHAQTGSTKKKFCVSDDL